MSSRRSWARRTAWATFTPGARSSWRMTSAALTVRGSPVSARRAYSALSRMVRSKSAPCGSAREVLVFEGRTPLCHQGVPVGVAFDGLGGVPLVLVEEMRQACVSLVQ